MAEFVSLLKRSIYWSQESQTLFELFLIILPNALADA